MTAGLRVPDRAFYNDWPSPMRAQGETMLLMESPSEALPRRRPLRNQDFQGFKTVVLDTPEPMRPAPQAFLIEQDALWNLRVHHHLHHQFQIVTAGSGTLGRHELLPGCVH